jgi:hypothetical protein
MKRLALFALAASLCFASSAFAATVTPQRAQSGNVAAASAAATLAGTPGKTTYLDNVLIKSMGATAATCVQFAITGADSGTINWDYCVGAGATTPQPSDLVWIPVDRFGASLIRATNGGSITATLPSLGAGNTNASVTLLGHTE